MRMIISSYKNIFCLDDWRVSIFSAPCSHVPSKELAKSGDVSAYVFGDQSLVSPPAILLKIFSIVGSF